ncbi:hypothetical protein FXW78_15620 [Rhodococcus opacus]|nr:hypothetical protein [Rhodococcus opacus]
MNTAEMGVLQQLAVSELGAAYSNRRNESRQATKRDIGTPVPGTDHRALGRLAELGLIAYRPHPRRGNIAVITAAGVEALSYLAATA